MSQSSSDKYVYFTVGVLKDSETLEALRQDAIKHHMIDYPGQLIAMRLAEHYEMMHNVTIQPVMRVPVKEDEEREKSTFSTSPHPVHPIHLTPAPPPSLSPTNSSFPSARPFTPLSMPTSNGQTRHHSSPNNNSYGGGQNTGKMRTLRPADNEIISTSPNADLNADEAADYWDAL
jgi:hypothetical protein